jgi:hypothetical protein
MAQWLSRLRNAYHALRATPELGVPWKEEVAPKIEPAATPLPAAFRRNKLPTYHATLLHFYQAEDYSDDPQSPYRSILRHAQGVAQSGLHEYTALILPEHTRLHLEYMQQQSHDGCHQWRNKRIPYSKHTFHYEVAWVGREAILIAHNVATDNLGTVSGVQHKRRTYVTRLSLPQPWYKLIHTLHLPPALASKVDAGIAPAEVG